MPKATGRFYHLRGAAAPGGKRQHLVIQPNGRPLAGAFATRQKAESFAEDLNQMARAAA